jgi:RNA polymerase sigma factor (TIGR02999 family)
MAPQEGSSTVAEQLFPIVYEELRAVARRQRRGWRGSETLDTTALVHEVYLRLAAKGNAAYQDRGHFMAVAATAMRQILIDYARATRAAKRGGGLQRLSFDEVEVALGDSPSFSAGQAELLITLDESLTRLAKESERLGRIVECRFFGGMSLQETADALGVSIATVKRGWALAQAWLYRDLRSTLRE